MREPTSDECEQGAKLPDVAGCPAYACWYPQMGGYVAKAVVVLTSDGCFEAYIWHDGEFPFSDEDEFCRGPVRHLHHCVAEQFISFGRFVRRLQNAKA